MPLEKKKTKIILDALKPTMDFIYLYRIRADISEHKRTTITLKQLDKIHNWLQTVYNEI